MKPDKNLRIEALRAIAILVVMAQHMHGRLAMPGFYDDMFRHAQFWPGVDLFFAISGYLICGNWLELRRTSPSLGAACAKFARRRFWRLAPALIAWMGFSILLAAVMGGVGAAAKGALAALLGVANVYWHGCVTGQIGGCGSMDYNSVAWSLSLELQLYLALSVGMMLLRPRLAVAMLLLLGLLDALFPAVLFSWAWLLRPLAFALGAMIALAPRFRLPVWSLLAGLLLAVFAPVQLPAGLVLFGVGIAGALCLGACLGPARTAPRVLVWIGERSYSLYLCHLPAILVVRALHAPWFCAPVLALGCAHLSFHAIEQRFRGLGRARAGASMRLNQSPIGSSIKPNVP
jgi:peptidoglycan/LPS O-acetylase OafA/YrhL